jgi:hypothetical protein
MQLSPSAGVSNPAAPTQAAAPFPLQLIPAAPGHGLIPLAPPAPVNPRQLVPANAQELDLDSMTTTDHPVVVRILREGWVSHIPLTVLTSERCRAAAHIDYSGSSDQGKRSQLAMDAAAEGLMPLGDWFDAWPRLCAHISRHLGSADPEGVASAFRSHFTGIMARYDFKELYRLYLEYDIHIRTLWVTRAGEFSPAIFYERTWSRIVESARNKNAALAPQFNASLPQQHWSLAQLSTGRSSQRGGAPSRGGQSFRGRGGQRQPDRASACYICGDSNHRGKYCPQSSNGYLTKVAGFWKGPGDSTVCFRFNGAGCSTPSCSFTHVCSRCGAAEHGAQTHA